MPVGPGPSPGSPDGRVLLVCTGNVCRSPIAAALLRDHLRRLDVSVQAGSAGTHATGGPPTDEAVRAMAERGFDITGHRSRALTPDLVDQADVVLTMERSHAAHVIVLVPDALRRTVPVRELGRRVWDAGARQPDDSIRSWVERALRDRDPRQLLGTMRNGDDIPDPLGKPVSAYRPLIDDLDDVLGRIARALVAIRAR